MNFDKDKIAQKWSPILNSVGLSGNSWLEEYCEKISSFDGGIIVDTGTTETSAFNWNQPLLPMVKRIHATTFGSGGWIKSKKQQLKENRINKLRKIKGEKPNVVLPEDQWIDGLVSVKPLSAPIGQLFYMDFKYKSSSAEVREKRKAKLEKLNNLIRINKIKYIEEILKKIIQENG